jgi:hypothetical protein
MAPLSCQSIQVERTIDQPENENLTLFGSLRDDIYGTIAN